jgi:hypothetical protein
MYCILINLGSKTKTMSPTWQSIVFLKGTPLGIKTFQ